MKRSERSCVRCGAVLASDQEYCLECGARRLPSAGERWRVPLIAAGVTVVLAFAVLAIGYQRMRDDADTQAAGGAGAGRVNRQGPASGALTVPGGQPQARGAPSAAASGP